MSKQLLVSTMCIYLFLNCNMLRAAEGYYKYVSGEKVEMVINYEYVVVDINENNFNNWDDIYNSESALDNTVTPSRLVGNSFRLKVDDLNETDKLVSSL